MLYFYERQGNSALVFILYKYWEVCYEIKNIFLNNNSNTLLI